MIWIVFGLMTLLASSLIAFPLLGKHEDGKHHLAGPLVLANILPLAAFALYLTTGVPNLPGAPFRSLEEKLTELQLQVEKTPTDAGSWAGLAKLYGEKKDMEAAKDAWQKAIQAAPGDLSIHLDYANFLLTQQASPLPTEFEALVHRIVQLSPEHPLTLFYEGLLAKDKGDKEKARQVWQKLLGLLPKESPLIPVLESEIRGLN